MSESFFNSQMEQVLEAAKEARLQVAAEHAGHTITVKAAADKPYDWETEAEEDSQA